MTLHAYFTRYLDSYNSICKLFIKKKANEIEHDCMYPYLCHNQEAALVELVCGTAPNAVTGVIGEYMCREGESVPNTLRIWF